MKIGLIVIDGQKDFCEGGKLAVCGGNAALDRVAAMIRRIKNKLDSIDITMDMHHRHHISHPRMWINNKLENPTPFTQINLSDALGEDPIWKASNPKFVKRQQKYILELYLRNKDREKLSLSKIEHTIWPEHCLIGTNGMCIQDNLYNAICEWEDAKNRPANKTIKGSYFFSEHFSVFKAEVEDQQEPNTQANTELAYKLNDLDILAWAGLAEDYCVMNSLIDFMYITSNNNILIMEYLAKKMIYLEDGTAAVGADPTLSKKFHDFLDKWNIKKEKTDTFLK